MLRIAFLPKDAYDLLRKDTGGFEYLFMQVRQLNFLKDTAKYFVFE